MANTNYIGAIVKILENPQQKVLKKNIAYVKLKAQFPQTRSFRTANLVFWGNLARDITFHYSKNDYLLIEGHLAFKSDEKTQKNNFTKKNLEITVLKLYPFFFNENPRLKKF